MSIQSRLVSPLVYGLRCAAVRLALGALLAAALVCLLIAVFWWGPARREQLQLTQQIDARRAALVRAEQLRQAARAYQRVLPALAAQEGKRQARAAQADLVQGIARLAARRGVRVVSQSFDEGKPQPGQAQPLYLDLGLVGDYLALRRLAGDLATLPMWLEIVEERLESAGQGGTAVKAQLRLLSYRHGQEAQP